MSYNYSVEQIKFIFIKNYWLRSIRNAIEILFVKNLCRDGTTLRLRFYDISGHFLYHNTNNYVCGIDMSNNYSVDQIKFIFIKNYWLRSIGNAIEILFVKDLCRVGTTLWLRFYDFLGQILLKNTNNYVCEIDMFNNYSMEQIIFIFFENNWLRGIGIAIEILFVNNLCRVGRTLR